MQVTGILTGDIRLIGESLDSDIIIEPVRGASINAAMIDVNFMTTLEGS